MRPCAITKIRVAKENTMSMLCSVKSTAMREPRVFVGPQYCVVTLRRAWLMLNVNWMLGFIMLVGWWVDGKLRGRLRAPLLERVFALMARRNLARRPLVERLAVDAEVDDALGLEAVLVLAAGDSDDGAVPDGVVVGLDRGDDDLGLASGHVVASDGAVGDAVGVRADDEVGVLLRDSAGGSGVREELHRVANRAAYYHEVLLVRSAYAIDITFS